MAVIGTIGLSVTAGVSPSTDALIAGGTTLFGVFVAVMALTYLHLAPTGLSPVREAVSRYGITTYWPGYRVQTMAYGLAGAASAWGVALHVQSPGARWVVIELAVFSCARLAISWFPMDAPGSGTTRHGVIHAVLAVVTFVAVTDAAIRLGRVLHVNPSWSTAATASTSLGWFMIATLLAMLTMRRATGSRRVFGLVERLLYVGFTGLLILIGVFCLTV